MWRRRCRRDTGFTGSASEDAESAGPLSVGVSSEGALFVGATATELPFSTTAASQEHRKQ